MKIELPPARELDLDDLGGRCEDRWTRTWRLKSHLEVQLGAQTVQLGMRTAQLGVRTARRRQYRPASGSDWPPAPTVQAQLGAQERPS